MKAFVFALGMALLPVSSVFAQEYLVDPDLVPQIAIGETFYVTVTIAQGDWGSSSPDIRNRKAEFVAPPGTVILDHEVTWGGHHSWVAWEKTVPAGNVAYDEGVSASLSETVKNGMLSGALTYEGVDMGSADGAFAYAKFVREFRAKYQILINTNSTITFAWGTHTKRGSHGAKINATAKILLQRQATEDEAAAALDVLKFVLESGHPQDVMKLIDTVYNGERKTAAELGLVADDSAEPPSTEKEASP